MADENSEEDSPTYRSRLRGNLQIILVALFLHWGVTALAGGLIMVIVWVQPDFTLPSILSGLFTFPGSGSESQQSDMILTVLDILVNLVGAAGSLALSAALVYIYLNQNEILDEQTTIQDQQRSFDERQTKIMQGTHVPMLTAHSNGVQFHEGRPRTDGQDSGVPEIEADEDGEQWISVLAENHGDTAEQLQLACLVSCNVDDDEQEVLPGVSDVEVEGMVTEPRKGKGGLLPSQAGLSLLRAEPEFSTEINGDRTFYTFLDAIRDQIVEEENHVRFGFVLIFSNSIGGDFMLALDHAYSIQPDYFDLKSDITMSSLQKSRWEYPVDDLIDDIGWEIPDDVFEDVFENDPRS